MRTLPSPDTISRGRSPTQLAARLAEAERAEFNATDHSDRSARQRTEGRRRRGNGGGELR